MTGHICIVHEIIYMFYSSNVSYVPCVSILSREFRQADRAFLCAYATACCTTISK